MFKKCRQKLDEFSCAAHVRHLANYVGIVFFVDTDGQFRIINVVLLKTANVKDKNSLVYNQL